MRGLQDKVAIVAGAAPGNIGGATALRLAQEGMRVTVADFNEAAAQAVVDEVTSAGGSAVARSSSSVWMGEPEHVAYQTAKSGLVGLTRHTATLGGKRGVRCNLVAPGVVLTKTALRATTEDFRKEILAVVRSPRLGAPEDIAGMVAFLFSDDGAYVNGQTILVDGGAHLT